MFGPKLLRRLYTEIRKRLFGRRRARRRLSESESNAKLVRLKLREHTHPNGGRFGQPVTNYYTKVYIGTPRRRFNIQFDLSLNDHFVPHKEKLRLSQHFKRGYLGSKSVTSEKIGETCKVHHLGCTMQGKNYVDDVRIELYPANKMRSRSMICKSSKKKLPDSDRDVKTEDENEDDDDFNDCYSSSDELADCNKSAKFFENNNLNSNGSSSGKTDRSPPTNASKFIRNRYQSSFGRDPHNIVGLRMKFVAIARDASNQYYQRKGIDGFFGLGLLHKTKSGCVNLVDLLKTSGHIGKNMFSISFNHSATKNRFIAPDLELCFGGYERTQFEEPIYWHKSPSKKQWLIKLTSIYLGDDFIGYFKNPRHLAVLTTSENEIFGPIEIVQRIYNLLDATQDESSGLYYVDCRTVPKLPRLRISTKRVTIILEPDDYIRQVDGKCFVAILPSGTRNQVQWRLGTCFLSRSYVIFNLSSRRIGFANLIDSDMIESFR